MGMVTEMRIPSGEPGRSMRFNYKGMHRYLITLLSHPSCRTIAEKETVLMVLSELRDACRRHDFELYAYCFLPRRLVMLARGKSEDSDMKKFLADVRARSDAAFKELSGHPLWGRTYQERVLRKTEITRAIADDIFHLPVKEGLSPLPQRYEFQGSFVLPRTGSLPPSRSSNGKPFRKAASPRFGKSGRRSPPRTRPPKPR